MIKPSWFSEPQATKEGAIALYHYELFNPAAIFQTPEGQFVLGWLKPQQWSEEYVKDTAEALERLLQYRMIANCPPVVPVWRDGPMTELAESPVV